MGHSTQGHTYENHSKETIEKKQQPKMLVK